MGRASRRKRERRERREFKRVELAQASEICGPWNRNKAVRTKCPRCDMDVFLHCSYCNLQVTGCLCSAVERMTLAEMKRFRDEIQKRKARESGLVLPPERPN